MKTLLLLALTAFAQTPKSTYIDALTAYVTQDAYDTAVAMRLQAALEGLYQAHPQDFGQVYDEVFCEVCERTRLKRFIFTLPTGKYYEGVCR